MTLRGVWTADILSSFHRSRAELIDRLGANMNEYSCLSDIREYAVLSAELAEIERASIADMPWKPKMLAFVVGSALKDLQSKRIAHQKLMKTFSTETEALEWLKSASV